MSRRRKTLIAAGFTYAQWFLTALAGLFLTRFLIRALGQDLYGTWLATGALLGYAALADLGILSVMPWLFAEADGAKDGARMRGLLAHGLAAGMVGGFVYLLVAACVWMLLPSLLHLSLADREALRGPVIALSLVTAVGYPLRLFAALRLGLQDYSFMGILGIVQTLLNLAIVVGLTVAGAGLYGVALGAAAPPAFVGLVAVVRTASKDGSLFRSWPRLNWASVTPIVTSGAGQWLGSLGWQLAFATDAVVIAYLGHRDLVPMFVVTSRLGLTLMQLSWALPDSASVGIAQLNAEEANSKRSGDVVGTLLRLQLLAAGLIACGVLAGNFGFVSVWVGRDLFGGAKLNAVLALAVVALSIAHGLMVPVGVLGRRLSAGFLTLLNGVVHILLALLFGRPWGLVGVALATVVSSLVTTIPAGASMLARMTTLTLQDIVMRIVTPWLARIVPCAAVAVIAGWLTMRPDVAGRLGEHGTLVASLLGGLVVGVVYLVAMRPIMRALPFGPRLHRALVALRLV